VGRPIVPIDYEEVLRRVDKAGEVWRKLVRRANEEKPRSGR
jgi:hypothetical protein